jgi:hypothetical protein
VGLLNHAQKILKIKDGRIEHFRRRLWNKKQKF